MQYTHRSRSWKNKSFCFRMSNFHTILVILLASFVPMVKVRLMNLSIGTGDYRILSIQTLVQKLLTLCRRINICRLGYRDQADQVFSLEGIDQPQNTKRGGHCTSIDYVFTENSNKEQYAYLF